MNLLKEEYVFTNSRQFWWYAARMIIYHSWLFFRFLPGVALGLSCGLLEQQVVCSSLEVLRIKQKKEMTKKVHPSANRKQLSSFVWWWKSCFKKVYRTPLANNKYFSKIESFCPGPCIHDPVWKYIMSDNYNETNDIYPFVFLLF